MGLAAERGRGLPRARYSRATWVFFGGLALASCGRSSLTIPPPAPPLPECFVDADCEGSGDACAPVVCVIDPQEPGSTGVRSHCEVLPPVDCDDGDPCTNDVCDAATGVCSYTQSTFDNDGDGYRGPRPGFLPGEPGACGDDCDDTSPLALPGGEEVCDGFDNDCNGVVDDGADFVPLGNAQQISGDLSYASSGGVAFSGEAYAAVYWGTDQGFRTYLAVLDGDGNQLNEKDSPLSLNAGDGAGGPVIWTGDRFGVAWQDRRTGDYETYFTFLDGKGEKKIPDTRLSVAQGFSVNVAMTWTGADFVTVWQDARFGPFDIFAQRVSPDGVLIGQNVEMTSATGFDNESPVLAKGQKTLGLTWSFGDATLGVVQFQTFDFDLAPASQPLVLTDGTTKALYPTVAWNTDRYIIAWYDDEASPRAIYAAAVDEQGNVIVPAQPVTDPGPFRSRYPQIKALGDRVLLLYADDRDQNNGYELYARTLDPFLVPLTNETRITFAERDSIYPVAAFGPDGTLGILFRDDRGGTPQAFFATLACTAGALPD